MFYSVCIHHMFYFYVVIICYRLWLEYINSDRYSNMTIGMCSTCVFKYDFDLFHIDMTYFIIINLSDSSVSHRQCAWHQLHLRSQINFHHQTWWSRINRLVSRSSWVDLGCKRITSCVIGIPTWDSVLCTGVPVYTEYILSTHTCTIWIHILITYIPLIHILII